MDFRKVRRFGIVTLASLGAALLEPCIARADFAAAVKAYASNRYDDARAEFLRLAEVGDPSSQFNLGAMAMHGEGVPKDRAVAVGWMTAAVENGYEGMTRERLDAVRASFGPDELARMQAIVDRYGRAAIEARAIPSTKRWAGCASTERRTGAVPDLSGPATAWSSESFMVVRFTVGIDGLARDPEVLILAGDAAFERHALTLVLRGRWQPALVDGRPVESIGQMFYAHWQADVDWSVPALRRLRQRAERGDPMAEYWMGALAGLDFRLNLRQSWSREMLLRAAQGGIGAAQYYVAVQFDEGEACRDAVRHRTWLAAAAEGGEASALVASARELLQAGGEPARVRELLWRAVASGSSYALRRIVALTTDPRMGPPDVELLRTAGQRLDKLHDGVDPQEDEARAAVSAAIGDWSAALKFQNHAIELATALAWNTSAMEERRARYEARQTWSGDLANLPPRTTPAPPIAGKTWPACYANCDPPEPVPTKSDR